MKVTIYFTSKPMFDNKYITQDNECYGRSPAVEYLKVERDILIRNVVIPLLCGPMGRMIK